MRVAVVHGYFLHDSGSGVYVRELVRALVHLGHEVTLICQERRPDLYDFIDSAYILDDANETLTPVFETSRSSAGSCRLVRPNLGGQLLVYVEGEFPPFERRNVHAFQNAPAEARDRYIERNVCALRAVFARWPPEIVLAQHLIMQPYVVATALAGSAPYVVTEHGSALNFSVRGNDALVPFAREGLEGATRVATVSEDARDDLVAWAAEQGLSIAEKTVALPPGIDGALFASASSRETAIGRLGELVDLPPGFDLPAAADVVAYAGALRPTKGVQHALAAIPIVAQLRDRPVRLLLAGDGPAREPLEELACFLRAGDVAAARRLVAVEPRLQSPPEMGPVVPDAPAGGDWHAAFLGHLDHPQLAAVFGAADVCAAPSVFPEAAALVNIEGLSAGALPIAAHHSGMVHLGDYLAESLGDPWLARLTLGPEFTRRLAESITHALDTYPTKDAEFRARLHRLALARYPTWETTAREYLAMAERSG